MLFPHIQSYIEQNSEVFDDSDTSDMIQIDLYTSYGNSEKNDNVFVDDPFCFHHDDQSILFDNELYISVDMDDDQYHISRIKFWFWSFTLYPTLVNFSTIHQNFLIHLIFPTLTLFTTVRHSLTNQIALCLTTNHRLQSEALAPIKIYDHYREQSTVFLTHHLPIRIKNHFRLSWIE